MNILGVIPARGGSKGVPRKNIRDLCGKPLLQYTAEAALGSTRLTRVILSTDDLEIAEVGRALGLDAPFLRPPELAEDTTPTFPVVAHALAWVESEGDRVDAVCLLQPTHPLRTSEWIDACIERFERSGADSLVTVLPVPPEYNPHWVYFSDATGALRLSTGESTPLPRRQDLPPAYHREGSVYLTRRDVIVRDRSLYGSRVIGFPVDPEQRLNIDTEHDWARAVAVLSRRERQPHLSFAGA